MASREDEPFEVPQVLLEGSDQEVLAFAGADERSVVVDWREDDEAIVERVASIVEEAGPLEHEELEDQPGFELSFAGRTVRVKLTESPRDRYLTLRGLARVLAKHFELRLFRATYQSDTHVFYVRPAWWWNEAERRRGDAIARLFRPTDETLEFP